MCFRVTDKRRYKAVKDITCYKTMYVVDKDKFRSAYINFQYETGYHYYNDNFPTAPTTYGTFAARGLHSYISRSSAQYLIRDKYTSKVAVRCVIPKGSYYFKNENQYFSSDLIVRGLVKRRIVKKKKLQVVSR